MPDYYHLIAQAKNLEDKLLQIERRRNEWASASKQVILHSLTRITQEVKLDWIIETDSDVQNMEAILLRFRPRPTKIIIPNEDGSKLHAMEKGAKLVYSQAANGMILVHVTKPFIDGVLEKQSPIQIDYCAPNKITYDTVFNHTDEFLKLINDWHDSDNISIRFRYNHDQTE